jgi:hypothetical protein
MQATNDQMRIGERLSIPQARGLPGAAGGEIVADLPCLLEMPKQHLAFPLCGGTLIGKVLRLFEERECFGHSSLFQKSETMFVAASPRH